MDLLMICCGVIVSSLKVLFVMGILEIDKSIWPSMLITISSSGNRTLLFNACASANIYKKETLSIFKEV